MGSPDGLGGYIRIRGDMDHPELYIIDPASASCIRNYGGSFYTEGITVRNSNGSGLEAVFSGRIYIGTGTVFGACSGRHIYVGYGGLCHAQGNYAITGGAINHAYSYFGSRIVLSNRTVTISNNPAFTQFVNSNQGSVLVGYSMTFNGGATGYRYYVGNNATIVTNGGGASFFPGDTAGVETSGGVYA
jgi:hypothetical protein